MFTLFSGFAESKLIQIDWLNEEKTNLTQLDMRNVGNECEIPNIQLSDELGYEMRDERKKNNFDYQKWENHEFTLKWFSISSCNVSLKHKFVILCLN